LIQNRENFLLSVVVPCFNEAEVIDQTHRRLSLVLSKNIDKFEIIYIDDGSIDGTLENLGTIADKNKNVKVLSLSRNFGHQIAVTAGIDAAIGDAVVVIDADLQDPPEVILEMIAAWKRGADVVYGVRASRDGETKFKLATAKFFYKLIGALSETKIPYDTGDFRLIDRKVVEAFKKMPERDRFIRGMISWIGFQQVPVFYDRDKRVAGETKYPIKKMLKFATDGVLSFSTKPLQIATIIGIIISALSFAGIIYALIVRLFGSGWVPGWTLLFISVSFLGGIQLIFLGLIGEYIGRIYGESKNRPLYFLNDNKKIERLDP
jgi:polyisoprenyl-phosphate glycosyltransferase